LNDKAVRSIEKYIFELEAPAFDPELPFGEGFDKDGFVTDPVVWKLLKK
jgi:hypothetical protein